MSNVETDENFSADFAVQVASASGEPHVEWTHNGTVLKDGPNHQVTEFFFK
jgi:hypothetical protein